MLKTILLGLVVWAVGASSPQSVPRVETREALQQLVTRVEPAPPPESVAAGIGGLVVAEIVVGVNGAVESARVIAGAEALHAAASDALKKWRFKPFMRNGKPSRVLALIDLHFPDPKGDEMKRQALAGRAAQDECGQQLREKSARALEICAEALRLAEAAGSDRSQYFRPRQQYGWALINAGRFTEALPVFVRAAEDWMTGAGDSDADAADALVIVAVLHRRLGNLPQSDEVFTRAAGMFERAIVALPDFVDYRERLAAALGLHAELKREMGQADAARALIAKAEEVLVEGECGRSGGRALSVVYGRAAAVAHRERGRRSGHVHCHSSGFEDTAHATCACAAHQQRLDRGVNRRNLVAGAEGLTLPPRGVSSQHEAA